MKLKRGIVEIFGRCSRLLNRIALNAEDGFFSQLCIKESDKLLSAFIFFLREEGDRSVVRRPQIVQREHRVAQYRLRLISQIKSALKLLEILKHLGLAKLPTSLLLEKDLLLLELAVLNTSRPAAVSSGGTGKPVMPKPRKKLRPLPRLDQTHKEILGFVKTKERVQNLEVFNQFAHISRRTMKRKLSELIKANAIKRFTDGKKVFYFPA
jgi:hypothetical protein